MFDKSESKKRISNIFGDSPELPPFILLKLNADPVPVPWKCTSLSIHEPLPEPEEPCRAIDMLMSVVLIVCQYSLSSVLPFAEFAASM